MREGYYERCAVREAETGYLPPFIRYVKYAGRPLDVECPQCGTKLRPPVECPKCGLGVPAGTEGQMRVSPPLARGGRVMTNIDNED